MRHDAIHPMECGCDRCGDRPALSFTDRLTGPDEISAIQKGAIAAMWATGILAAAKYTPSIIDWMTAR